MVPAEEGAAAAAARSERIAWLELRGYRAVAVGVAEIEADLAEALDRLAGELLPSKA